MINIMINEYVEICFSLNVVFITFYVFIILNYAHLNKNTGSATDKDLHSLKCDPY